MEQTKKQPKIHYAWVVLIGCTLLFFTIAGLSGNCYPVYSPFIMKEYGFSKTQISLIGSVGSLSATFSVFLTTPLYKKFSLRGGILLAGLLNAAAYFLFSLADSYPLFLLASGLKGFSYGIGSMVPIAMILEKWFKTKRTLALSIVSASSGLATIGVPSLITWIIQTYNFHISFRVSAIAFAALYLLAWLLIRNKPEDMGLAAYEGEEQKKAEKNRVSEDQPVKTLPNRWWMLLTLAIVAATCVVTCFGNLSMLSTTEGIAPEIVAIVVSTAGAALMGGKLIYGVVATKIGQKKTSLFFGIVGIVGLVCCCLVGISVAFLFFGTVCIGIAASSLVVGSVSWVNDWAEPYDRAEHVKVFQSAYNAGCLVNGLLAGILADVFGGSYIPFYAISAGIMVFFILVVDAAYRKQAR